MKIISRYNVTIRKIKWPKLKKNVKNVEDRSLGEQVPGSPAYALVFNRTDRIRLSDACRPYIKHDVAAGGYRLFPVHLKLLLAKLRR